MSKSTETQCDECEELFLVEDDMLVPHWRKTERDDGQMVCADCDENERLRLKHKPYVWTVTIEIDPKWVADGFDLDEDRLEEMLMQELSSATGSEVGGKVLKAPDPKQIRAEQGYKEPGYKPRNPDL
jgi:hypothetical protein